MNLDIKDSRGRIGRRLAREMGLVIDDHCYPPYAYIGQRFSADVSASTYTELEQELLDRLDREGALQTHRLVLTDAPEDYDWSGTRTLNPEWGKTNKGKTVRLAYATENSEAQMDRYGSGLHVAVVVGGQAMRDLVDAKILLQRDPVTGRYED